MLRVGCVTLLALLIGIPVVASRYLPAWGTLLVVVGEAVLVVAVLPKLIGFAFKRFAMGLFTTKSRVLRRAALEVHEVAVVDRPTVVRRADPAEDRPAVDEPPAAAGTADIIEAGDRSRGEDAGRDPDDEPEEPKRYVRVDFTIVPRPGQSMMQFYDPSELLLVRPGTPRLDQTSEDLTDGRSAGTVETIRLVDEQAGTETDDFDKINGRARLRAVFACPLTLTGRATLRYYFEDIGEVSLPG